MTQDHGYTTERCDSAISACTTLSTTSGEHTYWLRRERWWKAQRKFAVTREKTK